MTRFRGFKGQSYRLQITHLTNQNNIRVLSQRGAQRFVKSKRVSMNLTLIDQTFLALVNELDRVFNRQDMLITAVIDVVQHGRQCRALS